LFLGASGALKSALFSYGGYSDETIAQATPGPAGPRITLYDHFYATRVGGMTTKFDLTPVQARAFVLLHEIGHATLQYLHVPGVKAWSQEEVDQNIYEKCGFSAGGSW
jgi:hypothetical protein